MRRLLREIVFGIDAGHAIRHGRHPQGGGPFLHWVPDRAGGFRLAGDYLPEGP